MRKLIVLPLVLSAVMFALLLNSSLKADEWDKKTVVTFDQDVEIPGQVLPAGTYVFKLLRSSSDRFVVQVWSQGEAQLLATLLTIGDSYPNQSGDPYFVLDTSGMDEGYPAAIVSWFFAGSDEGRDFIYSGYSDTRIVDSQQTEAPQPDTYQSQPDNYQPQPDYEQPQPQTQPQPQPTN